jgi:hypothetical protein
MNIVYRPVFYLKQDVYGIRFYLQVKPTQLGPIDRASLCLQNVECYRSARARVEVLIQAICVFVYKMCNFCKYL